MDFRIWHSTASRFLRWAGMLLNDPSGSRKLRNTYYASLGALRVSAVFSVFNSLPTLCSLPAGHFLARPAAAETAAQDMQALTDLGFRATPTITHRGGSLCLARSQRPLLSSLSYTYRPSCVTRYVCSYRLQ